MNPFLFVVGCPRSGTTLLKRILDAHPELTITRETHWVTKLLDGPDAAAPGEPVTPALLGRLLSDERFQRLGVEEARLERLVARPEPADYAELVSTVYDLVGEQTGKPLVGDKTPRYVRHLPVLAELFPDARFVHLIRDGRDVCTSVRRWRKEDKHVARYSTWEAEPAATAALWWEQLVRLGREAGVELGPERYREIRYEALVTEPEAEVRSLCAFLDLPYSARMLRFHEGRRRHGSGLSAKSAWEPITAGLRDWRDDMVPDDLARFEAAAGDLLDELGYERGAPEPGAAALATAAGVRERFLAELGRRRIPAAWAR